MPQRERVVCCGPHLPGTTPSSETTAQRTTSEGGLKNEEDEADTTATAYCLHDGSRFLTLLPPTGGGSAGGRSNPSSSLSIVFFRRQFPVYPVGAPTEEWDMLRLHLGLIVHQAALDLNLPIYAVAAAVSAFHAVFPGHFTKEELCTSPHVVTRCMAACLFLAGKTSETNLKLREAVNCIDFLQWKLQQQHRLLLQRAAAAAPAAAPADNDSQQAQNQSLGGTDGNEQQKTTPTASSFVSNSKINSKSQESEAEEKQPGGKPQPTDEGATTKSASSGGSEEGEEKKTADEQGKGSDAGVKVSSSSSSTEATDPIGKKPTAAESQPEAGCTQKEDNGSGETAHSQNQGSESSRSRMCSIATFSRSSRYLKGYVPMGIREYWHVRQECLREEERLLHALGFSLPLPYLHDVLVEALILLLPTHQEAHLIWAITNDIAATALPDQFSPPVLIAAAALFAKKLLAVVATSFSTTNNETVPINNRNGACSSPSAGTRPQDSSWAEAEELSNSLSDSETQTKKGKWSSSSKNTGNRDGENLRELPLESLLPRCKTEQEEESRKITPHVEKRSNNSKVVMTGNAGPATSSSAAKAGQVGDGSRNARYKAGDDGMLEVLERLDPLLCGSPEYWALCKSHERRGLERGGSRWARALPPAALGWTILSPPSTSAAEAAAEDNNADSPATCWGAAAVAPTTERAYYPCAATGVDASGQLPADDSTGADHRIAVAVDGIAGPAEADTEEDQTERRRRLLREVQEDERQRKLVYVQVAEACARLMEVYSLLVKSGGTPNNCSAPAR